MQRAFSFTQGIQKIPEREILWLTISVGIWVIKYNVIWHINPEKAMKPIPHLKKKKKRNPAVSHSHIRHSLSWICFNRNKRNPPCWEARGFRNLLILHHLEVEALLRGGGAAIASGPVPAQGGSIAAGGKLSLFYSLLKEIPINRLASPLGPFPCATAKGAEPENPFNIVVLNITVFCLNAAACARWAVQLKHLQGTGKSFAKLK